MFLGILLHLSQVDAVNTFLDQMKFALNHPYMFKKKKTSFLVSWLGFFVNFLVE